MKKNQVMSKNIKKGNFAEGLAREELIKEGWEVVKIFIPQKQKQENGEVKYVSIMQIQKLFLLTGDWTLINALSNLNLKGLRLPDFICKKGNKLKLVEVKNSNEKINPITNPISQQGAIEELWKLGYRTEFRNYHINSVS